MESWIYNILFIIILYAVWALGMEIIVKKYTNCTCISLQTYMFAGLFASILFCNHIRNGCHHYKSINDIIRTPKGIIFWLIIISLAIIIANQSWVKAVKQTNSGFVSAITNSYIVIVTIISAYLFNTKIKTIQYVGIASIIGGCYLLTK